MFRGLRLLLHSLQDGVILVVRVGGRFGKGFRLRFGGLYRPLRPRGFLLLHSILELVKECVVIAAAAVFFRFDLDFRFFFFFLCFSLFVLGLRLLRLSLFVLVNLFLDYYSLFNSKLLLLL
jgi:hypothetical protein